MQIKNIKLFTGTMLSLVFCAVAGVPAIANPVGEQFQGQNLSQMGQTRSMTGTIRSITGDILTVEMENGETRNIGVSRAERQGIVPGDQVVIEDGRLVETRPIAEQTPQRQDMARRAETGPMRGTIRSMVGNLLSVEMEDGKTRNIGVSRVERQGLVPGTSVMVENGRITEFGPTTAREPQFQSRYTSPGVDRFEQQSRTPGVERPQMTPTTPQTPQTQVQQPTPPARMQQQQQPMMQQQEMEADTRPVRGFW